MSFTSQTTKTELIKSLQHFALNDKMYQNVISTQNVVNFWRHILPYLSFLMKDVYYKKRQFKFVDVIYKPNHENRTH